MLMKRDRAVGNDFSEAKWMSSANDKSRVKEAANVCVPSSRFLPLPPAEDDATY